MNSTQTWWWVLCGALVLIGSFAYFLFSAPGEISVGGERDIYGCLTPAGYSYSEEIGACVREFELTADIREAARVAVEHVG